MMLIPLAQTLPPVPKVEGEAANLLLAAVIILGIVILWLIRRATTAATAYRDELLATAARDVEQARDLATATTTITGLRETITGLRERVTILEQREPRHG